MWKSYSVLSAIFVLCFLGCVTEEVAATYTTIASADASISVDAGINKADSSVTRRSRTDTNQGTETRTDTQLPDPCIDKVCQDNNPCTTDACYMGQCQYTPVPLEDWVPCDDGNPCTYPDACIYGQCGAVGKVNCDDNNPCTTDACTGTDYQDPKGCIHTNNTNPCNDGNACTVDDNCQLGLCQSGTPVNCDDENSCTADSCDQSSGNCLHTPVQNGTTCNDQNGCTEMDVCKNGTCAGMVPMYQSEYSKGKKGFNCAACKTDEDCSALKGAIMCPSIWPGPPPFMTYAATPQQYTGKCNSNNTCASVVKNCSDGDPLTVDGCSSSDYSQYPTLVMGECTHTKAPPYDYEKWGPSQYSYTECWCNEAATESTCAVTNSGEVKSVTKKVCTNGCGGDGKCL